jgi:hypothetical protein
VDPFRRPYDQAEASFHGALASSYHRLITPVQPSLSFSLLVNVISSHTFWCHQHSRIIMSEAKFLGFGLDGMFLWLVWGGRDSAYGSDIVAWCTVLEMYAIGNAFLKP